MRSSPVARKSLGQHFLLDQQVVRRILGATAETPEDALIEIGPGRGALTPGLSAQTPNLIAVELDSDLAASLSQDLGAGGVNVKTADVLACTTSGLLAELGLPADAGFAVVGNLPYNSGAAMVRWFLEADPQPHWAVVMLQREVGQAMCAAPGRLSVLGVAVQVYAEARLLFAVPPEAFYPRPKVTSAVLRLDIRAEPLVSAQERGPFFRTLNAGFHSPRKRLRNSLASGLQVAPPQIEGSIENAGIDPASRPATLTLDDWLRLSRVLAA